MEAKDFRIGNFISDTNASDTFFAMVKKLDYSRCYYGLFHSAYSDLKPIPLTEEWVVRLGFNKWQDRYCLEAWSPGHPSQRFDIDWKDGNVMMKSRYQGEDDNLLMRHIKNVHQLQNLYFALTGKELELK